MKEERVGKLIRKLVSIVVGECTSIQKQCIAIANAMISAIVHDIIEAKEREIFLTEVVQKIREICMLYVLSVKVAFCEDCFDSATLDCGIGTFEYFDFVSFGINF